MIIWVVEFSREGHKIRKMDKNKYSQKKLFYFCELASCQKRPNSDFQSQFSTHCVQITGLNVLCTPKTKNRVQI